MEDPWLLLVQIFSMILLMNADSSISVFLGTCLLVIIITTGEKIFILGWIGD